MSVHGYKQEQEAREPTRLLLGTHPGFLQTPRVCCVSGSQWITEQMQTFLGSPRRAQKCRVSSSSSLTRVSGNVFLSGGTQRDLREK